ncbi:Uncharacterised protein [uncultured archaeon]|nr:Uncharacterised protein [uncultured archaeon]
MAEMRTMKPFEKPEGGSYIGTIIDFVTKEVADTDYATRMQKVGPDGKPKTKFQVTWTWVLNANDKEGRAFQVFETYDAYQNPAKPSKLDKALTQILNAAPPLLSDTDQLEPLLLNRANELFITKSPKVSNPAEMTVKVIGHTPLKPGQLAPQAPKDFIRFKNRTKGTTGPNPGQSTQTYAQQPSQPANNVSLNSAPEENEAF